nr:VTT domain-containing protein [Nocardiopsis mwathae]
MAFGFGVLAALFPFLNVEIYLLGAAALMGDGALFAMAVAAGLGQTLGKIAYYYLGRGALDIPWLKRRAQNPGRWSARIARLRAKAEGRPWWTAGLLAVSSFSSIPPFMFVVVLVGALRFPLWAFVSVAMASRTARFLLVVYAPGTVMGVLA